MMFDSQMWRGRPRPRLPLGSLDIWKTEIVLRRNKIFIATGIQIAVSSVGAAYNGQHLHIDLHRRQNLIRRAHNDELLKTNRNIIDARALAKNTSSC
jgi:hypothetical protein